jgi:hypothetical protein
MCSSTCESVGDLAAFACPSPLPLRRTELHPCTDLSQRLTVILNTSPTTAHPSTRLIEEVVSSFALVPGLLACRLIIVADGFKLRGKYSLKQGAVTEELAVGYSRFLSRLSLLTRLPHSPLAGAELLVLEQHHGCAHGFRCALRRVTTQFVLPVQHDRPFLRSVDLSLVLRAMDEYAATVHYVGLPTAVSLMHEDKICSRGFSQAFFRERSITFEGLRLLPLAAFLDSSHLARVDWYWERVFGPLRHARLPRGCFLEDTMGQAQLRELREGGGDTHSWYGTYLLMSSPAVVAHLDGHDSRAGSSSWFKWRFVTSHTSDEQWDAIESALEVHGVGCFEMWAERVDGYAELEATSTAEYCSSKTRRREGCSHDSSSETEGAAQVPDAVCGEFDASDSTDSVPATSRAAEGGGGGGGAQRRAVDERSVD